MEYGNGDMILYNGNVITVDENDTITEAVAVKGGKIFKVGSSEQIKELRTKNTQMIDLKGKTIIPGFIDAHTHLDLTGLAASEFVVDCHIPPCNGVEGILRNIREKVKKSKKGELLIGQGRFDQPYPLVEQLDQVAPDNPFILKNSMHKYTLNHEAMKKFGITKDHPTQEELFKVEPGAIIYRDPVTGEPTGITEEDWNFLLPNSYSPFSYEIHKQGIKFGLDKWSSAGVTSIAEFVDFPESIRVYQDLYRNGELNIKIQWIPCVWGLHKTVDLDFVIDLGIQTGFGNDWIRFMGVKFFCDRGTVTTLASIQLNEMIVKCYKAGLRPYIHAIARKAQDIALEAIEAAEKACPGKNLHPRIEHMGNEWHDETFFDRMQKIGGHILPTAYFMRIGIQEWLQAKTERVYPYKSLLAKGLIVPGNSDTAGTEPEAYSPLYNIWCMVARRNKAGNLIGPSEAVSVMDAIRMWTMHSAISRFEEKIKGSIEPGKVADFAVLAEDPLAVPTDHLKDIQVVQTIVDGITRYHK